MTDTQPEVQTRKYAIGRKAYGHAWNGSRWVKRRLMGSDYIEPVFNSIAEAEREIAAQGLEAVAMVVFA